MSILTATQQKNKEYLESLVSARVDELMPDNSLSDAPYGFIETELDMASEYVLTRASAHLVYPASRSGKTLPLNVESPSKAIIPLGSDFLRMLRLQLSGWKRPVDSLNNIDTKEYFRQSHTMSRGSNARPMAFLVPYSEELEVFGFTIQFKLDKTAIFTNLTDYQPVIIEFSYTNPQNGRNYTLTTNANALAVKKFISDNSDLVDLFSAHGSEPDAFPDFTIAYGEDGTIAFTPKNNTVVGAKVVMSVTAIIQFTNKQPLVLTGLPSAGTYGIGYAGGIPTGQSYTITGNETPAEHAGEVMVAIEALHTASGGTGESVSIVTRTDQYPILFNLQDPNYNNYTGASGDMIQRKEEDANIIWERPNFTSPPNAGYSKLTENIVEEYYPSGMAIECYSSGDGAIKEFRYVAKTAFYDAPQSLWDAIVWNACSRVLTTLKRASEAQMAFTNMVATLGGKLVGFREQRYLTGGVPNGGNDR